MEQSLMVKHYASFDLHSDNAVLVIIDDTKKFVFKRKFKNELEPILEALSKFRKTLCGVVVESTYNWYWLVDGLMANGYKVHLAHTTTVEGKSQKKYTNDYRDAFHLADLLRKGDLREGYIYPKEDRPLRDLLRKRGMLVQSRTRHIQSFETMVSRSLGIQMNAGQVKSLTDSELAQLFPDEHLQLAGRSNLSVIATLSHEIAILGKAILKKGKLKKEFKLLLTVRGIGDIIALAIAFEIGTINRFPSDNDYVSYCRCAPSKWETNNKKKGEGNRKNGNKYLSWAYIEAANFSKRFCPYAKAYYQKKLKKVKRTPIAIKALAGKIARANYHMLKNGVPFDPEKAFGKLRSSN